MMKKIIVIAVSLFVSLIMLSTATAVPNSEAEVNLKNFDKINDFKSSVDDKTTFLLNIKEKILQDDHKIVIKTVVNTQLLSKGFLDWLINLINDLIDLISGIIDFIEDILSIANLIEQLVGLINDLIDVINEFIQWLQDLFSPSFY